MKNEYNKLVEHISRDSRIQREISQSSLLCVLFVSASIHATMSNVRTYEDAIISEGEQTVEHINKINALLVDLNDNQVLEMIDRLRKIEKKMSLVYTFFKTSMFVNNFGKPQETNRPAI